MGKLYKRAQIWWYQHKGTRTSTGCRDKVAAEAASKKIERRIEDPKYKATERRLDDALDLYKQDQKQRGRSKATLRMIGYHITNLTEALGAGKSLANLTAKDVDKFIDARLKAGIKRTTVAKELGTLRGALRMAARRGEFPVPLESVMPYNFAQAYVPGKAALTLDQVFALISVLPKRRAAVVAFIVTTAADWQSVALAEAADVHDRDVLVRGSKNPKRWRTIPILEPFAILAMLAAPPFEPWGNVRRDLTVYCKKAKVPKVTPRDLRRSHGMILRALGVEPHLIASMMGHADSRMVERVYGKLPSDALAKLMHERLGS